MSIPHRRVIQRRAQAGVGLIEVLISVLVLSIGMLGLAGLQTWSLRNNQGAMERSMAVVQTHSIVDAMRADRDNAIAGGFNVNIDNPTVATGDTFATRSLTQWQRTLVGALGAGASGGISCANTGVCTIRVRWSDQRSVGSPTERQSTPQQEVTTEVRL